MSSLRAPRSDLFNTPLESGLRALFVLRRIRPEACDLNRLLVFDYALVHSGDFPGGPPSIHPATPLRDGELLVRRNRVKSGLQLMQAKGLVEIQYSRRGVAYVATQLADPFLIYFRSEYAERLRTVADWMALELQPLSSEELDALVSTHIGRWGPEFEGELVDGDIDA